MAERQLPKLNVAGSIPVSRSRRIKSLQHSTGSLNRSEHHYITYITRAVSKCYTASSLCYTETCVYTFWLTSKLCVQATPRLYDVSSLATVVPWNPFELTSDCHAPVYRTNTRSLFPICSSIRIDIWFEFVVPGVLSTPL